MDLSAFPYLQGNYAPVDTESDFSEEQLTIEGKVPEKLVGAFMRDGANVAYQPNDYVYPLDGDGMIHSVYFTDPNGIALEASCWTSDATAHASDPDNSEFFADPDPVPAVAELAGEMTALPRTRLA